MNLFGNLSSPNSSPQSNSSNSVPPDLGIGMELGALLEKVEHLEKDLARQESSCFNEITHVKETLENKDKALEKEISSNTENIKILQNDQNDTAKKVDRIYWLGSIVVAVIVFIITNLSNIIEFFSKLLH